MSATQRSTHLDPEHRLLLACALAPAATIECNAVSELDWGRLEVACAAHQLRPQLSAWFEAGGDSGCAPIDLRERVKKISNAHAGHGLMQAAELRRALQALADASVRAMPFKGPAFAAFLADGPRFRESSDLDLLVSADDVSRAAAALAPLGYVTRLPVAALSSHWLRLATDELGLVRDAAGGLVELHWRLGQRWFPSAIAIEDAWSQARARDFLGIEVAWPRAEELLLLHVTDGMKAGGTSVRWMADVVAIVSANPDLDWGIVRSIATRRGGLRTVRIALCAVERAARETAEASGIAWQWVRGARTMAAECTVHDLAAVERMFERIRADVPLGNAHAHVRWALRIADRRLRVLGETGRYLAGPAHADLHHASVGDDSSIALRWRALRRRMGHRAG